MIALAADHGGFKLKEAIKIHLIAKGVRFIDLGTNTEKSVDYPLYAKKVAQALSSHECERGILCCGTGIGISIAANKFKGIRAAICTDEFMAEMCRRHNDANVLALGERVISKEKALLLVDIFLNTEFDAGRHQARVDAITDIENNSEAMSD